MIAMVFCGVVLVVVIMVAFVGTVQVLFFYWCNCYWLFGLWTWFVRRDAEEK